MTQAKATEVILNHACRNWGGGIICCTDCYNSHGNCVDQSCYCHKGLRTPLDYCPCSSCKQLRTPTPEPEDEVTNPNLKALDPTAENAALRRRVEELERANIELRAKIERGRAALA